MKKTILIFGINSFVGSNLAQMLKKEYRVVGTYFSKVVSIPGTLCIQCNVLNRDAVQLTLYKFRPFATICAIGYTSIFECNENPKVADALNTVGAINIATFTERYKSKIIFLSTGLVFSGENKLRSEMEAPDPATIYGKTKAQAEFFIQKTCLNYIIFRSCQLFGRGLQDKLNIFEKIQNKTHKGESFPVDNNIHFGFLHIDYMAYVIKRAIELDLTNRLLHVSSHDVLSYYEFSRLTCEIFSLNNNSLQKGRWPFPEIKVPMTITGEGADYWKRYFLLNCEACENSLDIIMPSIRESLLYSFLKHGGNQATSLGSTAGIQFI